MSAAVRRSGAILLCLLAGAALLAMVPVAGAQLGPAAGSGEQSYRSLPPVPKVDFGMSAVDEPPGARFLRKDQPSGGALSPALPGFRESLPVEPHTPRLWQGHPPARPFVERGLTFVSSGDLFPEDSNPESSFVGALPASGQFRPDYTPITPGGRFRWVMKSTFGVRSLAMGVVSSGWNTWRNNPPEWGPGWEGFGKRFGSRQATALTSATIEASLGALWGEDPRYLRSGRKGFWPRTGYAVKMAFFTYRRDGSVGPAYARFTGIAASRAISSTWRPPSSDDWQDTTSRVGWAFVSRMVTNLWSEFWPDKWRRRP